MAFQRVQPRAGTAAEWTAHDDVLRAGEVGYETDTGLRKYGDGSTPWSGLSYALSEAGADAAVAALFDDPGTAAAQHVQEAVHTATAAITPGPRTTFFGDSITNVGEGYPYYVAALSKQQIQAHQVTSHPGYTSGSLAPLITEVTQAADPGDMCLILAGSNDAAGNVPLATYAANMTSMFEAVRDAGIAPVAATIPPRGATGTYLTALYNGWLRKFAFSNRIPLVDFASALTDPATGGYLAALDNGDHIHPSNAGNVAMANEVIRVLAPAMPPAPSVTAIASGGINMLPNSSFLADANADGIPDGYSAAPSAGFAWSLLSDPAGYKWQRITLSGATAAKQILSTSVMDTATGTLTAAAAAGATTVQVSRYLPAGTTLDIGGDTVTVTGSTGTVSPFTLTLASGLSNAHGSGDAWTAVQYQAGDVIEAAARFRSGQSAATSKHTLQCTCYTAGFASVTLNRILTSPNSGMTQQIDDGVGLSRFTVPSTTAIITMALLVGPGDGTYDYAQPTLRNLTRLGIV